MTATGTPGTCTRDHDHAARPDVQGVEREKQRPAVAGDGHGVLRIVVRRRGRRERLLHVLDLHGRRCITRAQAQMGGDWRRLVRRSTEPEEAMV